MIRKFVLAALASMLATPLLAADLQIVPLPAKKAPFMAPQFTWTGFYLGVNGGYGAQNTQQSGGATGSDIVGDALAGLIPVNIESAPRGPLFGGQFGYNEQIGWLFLGLEEQIDWAHIANSATAGSSASAVIPAGASATASQQVDWLSFTNVRVGVVPGPHFVSYLTGGLAVGGVQTNSMAAISTTVPGVALSGSQSLDQIRVGWDVGLGFEFAMNQNWTLRADAKYFDLGTPSGIFQTNGAAGVAPVTINFSDPTKGYIGTVGVSYKFN